MAWAHRAFGHQTPKASSANLLLFPSPPSLLQSFSLLFFLLSLLFVCLYSHHLLHPSFLSLLSCTHLLFLLCFHSFYFHYSGLYFISSFLFVPSIPPLSILLFSSFIAFLYPSTALLLFSAGLSHRLADSLTVALGVDSPQVTSSGGFYNSHSFQISHTLTTEYSARRGCC